MGVTARVAVVIAVALAAAGAAAAALRSDMGVPAGAPTLDEMTQGLGSDVMLHLQRGHVPGRSGEIYFVPKPHYFMVSKYDLRSLATPGPDVKTTHPNPWDYLTRVPIVLYGPGRIPAGREVDDPVDIAAIAPTYARVLGMDDFRAAAEPLPGATSQSQPRPRAIVTVVIDGGGWNALAEHPNSWPAIARLRAEGTTYTNATIGSAPATTGALHATFGTGFYPVDAGIPGNFMRLPDGSLGDVYLANADPRFLELPTVSELWDEATGNEAIVGTVSFEGWHLGMIGHGAQRTGGDHDIAVLWEREEQEWFINTDYYELPDYVRELDVDRLERYEAELDDRDGIPDGLWFGHTPEELQDPLKRPGSPAFARLTGDAVVRILRRAGVGRDGVTDLFWIEMKMPDFAGHLWNVVRPEQADVLFETDRQIARIKAELDRIAGPGGYILAVSADHGQQPLPELAGGWRISIAELQNDIVERYGEIVEKLTPSEMYLDMDAVADKDVELVDVARWLATYTVADNVPRGAPGAGRVPEDLLARRVFAGVFPTTYLAGLDPDALAGLGPGSYPQGDLSTPPGTVGANIP